MRSSWRAYKAQPVEQEKLARLRELMRSLSTGPFGGHARFELVECPNIDPTIAKKLSTYGTYGVVKGAQYFLIGIMTPAPMDLEDFGYLFEELILLATDLELGTVWLAGTFNRSDFANYVHITGNETVPAVSPVGYVTDKRRFLDSIIRRYVKATTRKPWEQLFFMGNFHTPLAPVLAEPFNIPLEMVRLGPSAKNWQPWRVVKDQGAYNFHFYIQHVNNREDGGALPGHTRVDCGIAMCHFDLSTVELKLPGKWVVKDPQIVPLPPKTRYVASWISNSPD
jgi:hypothetical protein